jgi:glycosyltransferase involved in cell wall biosynthesis
MQVLERAIDRWRTPAPIATVAINRRPVRTPFGGGNQWLGQLTRALRRTGYSIRFDLSGEVDCIVVADPRKGPTASFDCDAIAAYKAAHPRTVCLQRVNDNDRHRGSDSRDAAQAAGNQVADHTVFVSAWLRDYDASSWFDLQRPHSVIGNGADPRVFHPLGQARWDGAGPLRLVTHHWSTNWNKGFAAYQELDGLIAEGTLGGVELWVVGRWPDEIRWRAARTFGPAHGQPLARLLRQCHAAMTASRWESGPMHVVEAIQCGLPVIYHADGGAIGEYAAHCGVAFTDDVRAAVGEMRDRYHELRRAALASPPCGDRMCVDYRTLIQRAIDGRRGEA